MEGPPLTVRSCLKNFNKYLIDELRSAKESSKTLTSQLSTVSETLELLQSSLPKSSTSAQWNEARKKEEWKDSALRQDVKAKTQNTTEITIDHLLYAPTKQSIRRNRLTTCTPMPQEQKIQRMCHRGEKPMSFLTKSQTGSLQEAATHTVMPFVAGTSTSRSHNICLSLQHMLAQYKRQGFVTQGEVGAMGDFENECHEKLEACPSDMKEGQETDIKVNLHGKAKNHKFKELLSHLYNEFTDMVQQYEGLMCSYDAKESSRKCVQPQLQALEKQLRSKEDEIIIFIDLYREVIKMKDRVKNLEKANQRCANAHEKPSAKQSESTNLRMKFLLRQINKLQECLSVI